MPKSKKPARRGTRTFAPDVKKPGFMPTLSRLPKGLSQDKGLKGGKPKLFPGRTGSR